MIRKVSKINYKTGQSRKIKSFKISDLEREGISNLQNIRLNLHKWFPSHSGWVLNKYHQSVGRC